ncbi:MAG: hypothetical protein RPV21_15935 [Candidatus Sedimenticola sp. (ex Thyasira tokunagai)]
MIDYEEKGSWLYDVIHESGHSLVQMDGEWIASDEIAVQAIIDTFDPLPHAREEALALVKEASAEKRLQFVTQAAGKDAEYTFKAAEAAQYNVDAGVGVFMAARMLETGETADEVATEWNLRSAGWKQIGAYLGALEDRASRDMAAETDWQQCRVIAKNIIERIEAIQ